MALPALSASLDPQTQQAQLALDLATGMFPPATVFANHGVNQVRARQLMADSQFVAMVREYRRLWRSPLNATDRVRLKSAVAVEDSLAHLYALFHDDTLTPSARLDAFKQLVALSDMSPKPQQTQVGERFHLTINLPAAANAQPKVITIDAEPTALPESAD